ncbi:hypothetical protein L9F63_012310, partial [Diploptera punctata]
PADKRINRSFVLEDPIINIKILSKPFKMKRCVMNPDLVGSFLPLYISLIFSDRNSGFPRYLPYLDILLFTPYNFIAIIRNSMKNSPSKRWVVSRMPIPHPGGPGSLLYLLVHLLSIDAPPSSLTSSTYLYKMDNLGKGEVP